MYFIIQTTELFETLSKDEPENIECKEQTLTLDQVLKIVPNDSSSASLRIPKVANRPADFKLNNGHTSELTIYIRPKIRQKILGVNFYTKGNWCCFLVPALGFGTAGLYPDDRLPAILTALDSGYRYVPQ